VKRPGLADAAAAAAGAVFGPPVLHIGADEYGGALALIAAAGLLHWRCGWALTRCTVWFWIAAAIADRHVVRQTIAYLTGVQL
jgi:hypothetical protein